MKVCRRIRNIGLAALALACVVHVQVGFAGPDQPGAAAVKAWPEVLLIDDFESGVDRWVNEGTGAVRAAQDAGQGKVLAWSAPDDGKGYFKLKDLSPASIDFSRYDTLMMRIKVSGKPVWNVNPILQQYPAAYGFRALYYSVDTMHPHEQWFTLSQDLWRWENAWPDTFDKDRQEFAFEIHQLAGSGQTTIYIDDIRLLKNPLAVKPSYSSVWAAEADGGQVNHFQIQMTNSGDKALVVRPRLEREGSTIARFAVRLSGEPMTILPGESVSLPVAISASAQVVKNNLAYYGESARIGIAVENVPGLVLFTELMAATRPLVIEHPSIMCDAARARELQLQYRKPDSRAKMDRGFQMMVAAGEKALGHAPTYPTPATTGRSKDPISGGALVRIDVPSVPFNVYQDPLSGRTYSGPLYDAGMLGHVAAHMRNAASAKAVALAYLVTGRKEFAEAAARILKDYIRVYPTLPHIAYEAGSPVGSNVSGATRIGGTYMRERVWLADLAVALDSIRAAGVLTEDQVKSVADNVFRPSAHYMMDHKVGVMNLQWMIQSASLMAGLASDAPDIASRAVHSPHGILRLTDLGFLDDGFWWENPSYQGVAKLAAFPALSVAMHNGLIKWSDRYEGILLSAYKMNAPDGRSPTLGTGGYRNLAFENTGTFMFTKYIRHPELGWVLHNAKPTHGTYGLIDFALFRQAKIPVPIDKAVNPVPDQTTVFPHYGGIAMRVPGTDRYCYLHYGRELVHGHRNKLSINAYGAGGWYARNVMGGYGPTFASFLETIASSTSIIVDGKNADADTGELLFHQSTADYAAASAREVGAWKDAEHERAVVLTAGPMIVIDRVFSNRDLTCDWLYQSDQTSLTMDIAPFGKAPVERLGEDAMYDVLKVAGVNATPKNVRLTRENQSGLTIGMPTNTNDMSNVYATDVTGLRRPFAGLVWRKQGKAVSFAAAYQPFAPNGPSDVTVTTLDVTDAAGKKVDLMQGQAVKVETAQQTVWVLVNYSGKPLTAGELSGTERVIVKVVAKADAAVTPAAEEKK